MPMGAIAGAGVHSFTVSTSAIAGAQLAGAQLAGAGVH